MSQILSLILENIVMVFVFMIPFVFVRLSDICFGIVLSFKDINLNFDWKKLLRGLLWSIIIILGIGLLASGIVSLPELMKMYNIDFVDVDSMSQLINVFSIISIIVTSIITYGKDAYLKLVKIFKISDIENITSVKRIDENGDEDVRYS